jgi:peptidoglycan glycosyltransferase
VATDGDFAPLIDRKGGPLTIGAHAERLGTSSTLDTTLDPVVQKAALAALGNYRGSLVAIDPRSNEILAIANHETQENLALQRQYEPGSVIKVLTGLNALTSGINVDSMFPYVCNGELMIDGRHFGDWMPQGHGRLRSIDDALAVSCNVFFADIGLRLGRDRLERFMKAAGFDGQANLSIFQVPLGRSRGAVFNNFETGFLAIGLEHEEINAIHMAMLASMMANRGVLTTPRLLRQRRSILGDVVASAPQQGKTRIATAAAAERMIQAMRAVTTEPRGTGRRAPVEGLSLAMKTGTAGERKRGLEALIMAFAPVESPKIAFGIIAEDAGPAEFAGAKIAHDFLERIKPRL